MKNRTTKRRSPKIVITKVAIGNSGCCKMLYFEVRVGAKKIDYLFALLVTWIWRLLLPFFCQFLFQAAFTIAMHRWLVPVLAKVFGYVVLISVVLAYYHNLVKGL